MLACLLVSCCSTSVRSLPSCTPLTPMLNICALQIYVLFIVLSCLSSFSPCSSYSAGPRAPACSQLRGLEYVVGYCGSGYCGSLPVAGLSRVAPRLVCTQRLARGRTDPPKHTHELVCTHRDNGRRAAPALEAPGCGHAPPPRLGGGGMRSGFLKRAATLQLSLPQEGCTGA